MAEQLSNLLFLEYPDEVDACLSSDISAEAKAGSSQIVALNPATLTYLKRLGYHAEDTQAYLTTTSRDRAVRKSAELSQWIKAHFDYQDSWGVRIGYSENLVWYNRWLLNYLLCAVEILDTAVSRHNPRTLVACVPQNPDLSGPWAGTGERYFGAMAQRYGASKGIEFRAITTPASSRLSDRLRSGLRPLVTGIASSRPIAFLHHRRLRRLGAEAPLLFTNDNYRMNVLAEGISQETGTTAVLLSEWGGRHPTGWAMGSGANHPFNGEARLSVLESLAPEDSRSRRLLKESIEKFIEEVAQATDVFSHVGTNFADIVAAKVRSGIGPSILNLHRRTAALRMALNALKPSLVFSNGSRIDDMIVGELCRASGIPAMMVTHGSHPPPSNEAQEYELGEHGFRLINGPFAFTALQSPVAEEFQKAFPVDSVAIRTGPLIWATGADQVRSQAMKERMLGGPATDRVVVHAGTPKRAWGMRFQVYETYDEYVQSIRDLAAAIDQVPDARLIVKFRPSRELGVDDLKSLVVFSEKSIVSVVEPLPEVLGFTDLVVSFASTVIEEALQNSVPVLLYGGEGRYKHIAAPTIAQGDAPGPRATYHVEKAGDLPYGLKYILSACDRQHRADGIFDPYVYRPDQVVQLPQLLQTMAAREDSARGRR